MITFNIGEDNHKRDDIQQLMTQELNMNDFDVYVHWAILRRLLPRGVKNGDNILKYFACAGAVIMVSLVPDSIFIV